MSYYASINKEVDYDGYWGVVKDPDGKERTIVSVEEEEKYVRNVGQEIEFINNLPETGGGPHRILDIGFGCGYFLNNITKRCVKHGVDPHGSYRGYHTHSFNSPTYLHFCNLHKCKFDTDKFDVVVLYHVIEHIENPEKLIEEVYRILKPNGILLLGTPNFGCWCARRFGSNFRLLHDKTHISLFSKESMTRFLGDYGFTINKIRRPFFKTNHFTIRNLFKLLDTSKVSPPFFGNVMTFYCTKEGEFGNV